MSTTGTTYQNPSTPLPLVIYIITTAYLGNWLTSAKNHVHDWEMRWAGWIPVVASTSGLKDGLLFIWDKTSGSRILVDTRAEVSVFLSTGLEMHTIQPGPSLVAANGSTIKTYGVHTIPLCFETKMYKWDFIIAEVSCPLLEADFLCANSLLINLEENT